MPDVDLIAPKAAESLPSGELWVYEPKYDGYRIKVSVVGSRVELRSRRGTDLTSLFPDVSRSATVQIPGGTVLDGELLIVVGGRLSFDALQQRMAAGVRRAPDLARVQPASAIIFDVLRLEDADLTGSPWHDRRTALEQLADGWRPPLQITPYTADRQEAIGWMDALAQMGIEGIVAKRTTSTYRRDAGWVKVRYRETLVGVIGAVIGSMTAPEALVIGRMDPGGQLEILGRTVALSPVQSAAVGSHLRPPMSDHPWPDVIGSGHFGGPVAITRVEPEIIAEVSADPAEQAGHRRHLLRFVRLRLD